MRGGTPQPGAGAAAGRDVALPALISAFAATLHPALGFAGRP